MPIIYEPRGRAREYSPLALNHYTGCEHGCDYCYVPVVKQLTPDQYKLAGPAPNVLNRLKATLRHQDYKKQVLLSFAGDPYSPINDELKLTGQVLSLLYEAAVPVAVLTKGGRRCLIDKDLFLQFAAKGEIKVGSSLVFNSAADREKHEPDAAPTDERISVLRELHEAGVRTWASMEPVIDPAQSLALIKECLPHVDEFKLGKINHFSTLDRGSAWREFLVEALAILRPAGKAIYVKTDLRDRCSGVELTPEEKDKDATALSSDRGQSEMG